MYEASATVQCSPAVTGPCNVVKQLPSCTISALWANPVGGRSDEDRAPEVAEMNESCTVHTLRPSGRAITLVVSKETRSPTSRAMKLLRLSVSVPIAHSVVMSAWATVGAVVTRPDAAITTTITRAVRPPIEQC